MNNLEVLIISINVNNIIFAVNGEWHIINHRFKHHRGPIVRANTQVVFLIKSYVLFDFRLKKTRKQKLLAGIFIFGWETKHLR